MAQTTGEMDERLAGLEATVELLYGRITDLETTINSFLGIEDNLPPWGLEIIEALIEALKGVRLQGAQEFALALEAKYFPVEKVGEETVTI